MSAGRSRAGAGLAEERRRREALARALACAFWRTVQQGEPLPVMAAMEAAAHALGTLYRQSAQAHGPGGTCGCGWQPDPVADRLVLEAMLVTAMRAAPESCAPTGEAGGEPASFDLAGMTVAGRA